MLVLLSEIGTRYFSSLVFGLADILTGRMCYTPGCIIAIKQIIIKIIIGLIFLLMRHIDKRNEQNI